MARRVTVVEVDGTLSERGRALLSAADLVIATRAQLAAVRGLVPARAVVDVLGDTALEDPEGHRWDVPVEPEQVVVLAPAGNLAGRIAAVLGAATESPTGRGTVAVVGLDLGSHGVPALESLSEPARAAVRDARLVAGERSHLDALDPLIDPDALRVALDGDLEPLVEKLLAAGVPAAVLAAGDPGFFGIVGTLNQRLKVVVHPAVSSIARICAEAGESWDDAIVIPAHDRDPGPAVNACRRYPKVVVLTAPGFGPAELATALGTLRRDLVIGSRFGLPDESVQRVPAELARTHRPADPTVVLVLDPDAPRAPQGWAWPPRQAPEGWALDEDDFEGAVPGAEVRALVLAWLGPGLGDLVWDLGAGSVAVECARLGAAAVAVDRDPEACERIRGDAARHGVPVDVVQGVAPQALEALPGPDAVFIGGGGDDLPALLEAVAARGPRVVVTTLPADQPVDRARAALVRAGLAVDATRLQAAPLGRAAPEPVVVLRGRRG